MKNPVIRGAILAGFAVVLVSGCGQQAPPSPPVEAQRNLQPPAPATTDESAAPASLTILNDRTAEIEPVATDSAGVLNPPVDVDKLGWWVDSALPGDPGTVVVTGHINAADQGPGFAGMFAELKPGDRVEVDTANGPTEVYVVEEVANYSKAAEFPMDRLNALTGPEALALITCGGQFVGPPLGYEDNVIAWAVPEVAE